jgi:hypothetical protein
MFKTICKYLFFTAVVLLFGQIPVGGRTIGEHFQQQVKQGLVWSGEQIRTSHWYGSLGSVPYIGSWFQSSAPAVFSLADAKVSAPVETKKSVPAKRTEDEKITLQDRESLLQLLEDR